VQTEIPEKFLRETNNLVDIIGIYGRAMNKCFLLFQGMKPAYGMLDIAEVHASFSNLGTWYATKSADVTKSLRNGDDINEVIDYVKPDTDSGGRISK